MRATGGGEVPVPAYELFSSSQILGRMALAKMLGGLSSRVAGRVRGSRRAHPVPGRHRLLARPCDAST